VFGREAWPSGAFAFLCQVFGAARPARGQLWVALGRDRRVLGYAGIEVSALGGEADLVNLAVDPAARRQGIGRQLLGAAVAYCRGRRVSLLWLRVRASNRTGRAFYRRCGVRPVGRFRGYYDAPREDAILMSLSPTRQD